jgi:prepilin-type N-terminal cleavage/methylation domain-containing protein
MNNKNKKGFTLIELLVVIAIIGLLSTLSVVALNNARARARDARRVADIKQIQTALELYFNSANSYPSTLAGTTTIQHNGIVFMDPIPEAPTPSDCTDSVGTNTYVYTGDTDEYSIRYCLGSDTGGLDAGAGTATEMTISE